MLSFLNLGGPEVILMIIVFGGVAFLPAFLGYNIGSGRQIGGVGGLFVGLFFSYLGVLVVYLASPKINEPHYNFNAQSSADELKKYKDLLDRGAISEQEYKDQKARILGK